MIEEAINVGKFARYVVEQKPEGTYLFVWKTSTSQFPEYDSLQDTVGVAKEQALEEFGVSLNCWREVPTEET